MSPLDLVAAARLPNLVERFARTVSIFLMLAKILGLFGRYACKILILMAFLLMELVKLLQTTANRIKQAAMRISSPKSTTDQARGFYVVPSQPAYLVHQTNWRLITGVAILMIVTNVSTYLLSERSPKTGHTLIEEVQEESLYLLEKASYHVTDLNAFEFKVRHVSQQLDIPPEWLMAVMYLESKFDPSIKNLRGSGATGLIQFMVPTVRELNDRLGTEYYMSDIQRMPAHVQLDLVREYLQTVRERYGEFDSLTDLYLGILYPRAISQDFCYALFAKPTKQYDMNRGLDENRDGVVTVSDIDRRMKRMFPTAYLIDKGVLRSSI